MVVSIYAPKEEVRAYIDEQVSQGLEHVVSLLKADSETVMSIIGDLTEEEGAAKPQPEEWSIAEALNHVSGSFVRSQARIQTLASGQPFENPAVQGGAQPAEVPSFVDLRQAYAEKTAAVIEMLDSTDPAASREQTADHVVLGPFDWLQWAVYSHHVHVHDHIGQMSEVRKLLGK